MVRLGLLGLAACDMPATAGPASEASIARELPRRVLTESAPIPGSAAIWQVTLHREAGAPQTVRYALPAVPGVYRLELLSSGDAKVNASVQVNGDVVIRPSDFAAARDPMLSRMVVLAATNRIDVRLTGVPGSSLTVRVIEPGVGTTDTVRWIAHCAVDGTTPYLCFDATLATTWLAGNRTSISLRLRNSQGSVPQPLPPSAIQVVSILAPSGTGPTVVSPVTVNTTGATSVVGSTVVIAGGSTVAYPPYPGGPSFYGVEIAGFALGGCSVPPDLGTSAYWLSCGAAAPGVVFGVEVAGRWNASDLFLHLSGQSRPVGLPQPSCATGLVPLNRCQPLL